MKILTLLLPLIGTTLGAAMVFFMKNAIGEKLQHLLLGFAAGVMIAASVWSLLIPSIEMSEAKGNFAFVPAAVGFLLGIAMLLAMDTFVPHLHMDSEKPEGPDKGLKKTTMMMLAVTIHNIPEGMAVGVAFAGALSGKTSITAASAFVLALGIAIQNFPEGAIVSMPLIGEGFSKKKAFLCGFGSGVVEPIGTVVTIWLTAFMVPVLPYLLSFAAGAMFYVVIEELIPESQVGEHSNIGTIGAAFGFVVMMVLDVALG